MTMHSQAEWQQIGTPLTVYKKLILHHTAGHEKTMEDINNEHLAVGDAGIGYHKVFWPDGSVKQGRPDDIKGAQAHGANSLSEGYCIVGDFSNSLPSEKALKSFVQAAAKYCNDHKLKASDVIGHRDVASLVSHDPGDSTACPGDALYHELVRPGGLRDQIAKYLK